MPLLLQLIPTISLLPPLILPPSLWLLQCHHLCRCKAVKNQSSSSGLPKAKLLFSVLWYLPSRNMGQVLEDTWGRFPLTLSSALRVNQSISMLSSHELPVHLGNASLAKKPFASLIFFLRIIIIMNIYPEFFFCLGNSTSVKTCIISLIFTTTLWDSCSDYSQSIHEEAKAERS